MPEPDVSILSDLISTTHHWEQSQESPAHLLKQVLPVLVRALPAVTALRLYQSHGGKLLLTATSDFEDALPPGAGSEDDPFLSQALAQADGLLLKDEDSSRWAAALRWENRPFYLLEIHNDHQTTPPSPDVKDWLTIVVQQLTTALKLQAMRSRMQRFALAMNELVAGQSLEDIALIIARHMLPQPGRLMVVGRLTYDEHSRIKGWELIANVNRKGRLASEDTFLPWEAVGKAIQQTIFDGEPFVVNDLKNVDPDKVGPAFYERLSHQGVQSYLNIPFVLTDQTNINLAITSLDKDAFPPEEVASFRNIVAIAGGLIDVDRLAVRIERANAVVDDLVLANRLVATAANAAYMTQAVIYTLAKDLCAAAITLFDHPLTLGETPNTHQLAAFSTETDVIEVSSHQPVIRPDAEKLQNLHAGLPIILSQQEVRKYLAGEILSHLENVTLVWGALFGMRSGNQLLGILTLVDKKGHALSDAEVNAYTTLADQMGVVLHSRQLLQVSQEAHEMTAQLVQTNRAISSASGYDEMIQTILHSMPEQVLMAGFLIFDSPVIDGTIPNAIKTNVIATHDALLHPELIDQINPHNTRLEEVLQQLAAGEPIHVPDDRQVDSITPNFTQYIDIELRTHNLVFAGLRMGEQLLGILVCGLAEGTQLSNVQLDNLRSITDQTAITIENRRLFEQTTDALGFVHTQFEATSTIYHADNPVQMLRAIYRFAVFSSGYFDHAQMILVENAEHGGQAVFRVVAEIDNGQAKATTHTVAPDTLPGIDPYQHTLPRPAIILDIENATRLSDTEKEQLRNRNIGALITLPLIAAGQRLLGLVHITGNRPVEVTMDRMRALGTLVEQVAVVLENRELLRRTETSLTEVQTLFNTNRDLLSAQDSNETLLALQKHLAPDALAISLFSVHWDELLDQMDTITLDGFLSKQLDTPTETDFTTHLTPDEHQVNLIENVANSLENRPDLQYFYDLGARSLIIMPIVEEDHLLSQITILFADPRLFDQRARNLFAAIRDQLTVVLQNHRLLHDTRIIAANLGNQVRVLRTINHLASTISGTQDEQILMDTTCEALFNALRTDYVSLALFDLDGLTSTVVSEYPKRGGIGIKLPTSDPLLLRLQEQQAPIMSHIRYDPDLSDNARKLLLDWGMEAMLFLPLQDTRSGFIGSIALGVQEQGYTYETEQIDIARTITAQIAVSLQNIRLLQSTQRQANQMELIAGFSRSIQTTLDIGELLRLGLTNAAGIIEADNIAVALVDQTSGKLRMAAQKVGAEDVYLTMANGEPVTLEKTTAGKVWNTQVPLSVPNLLKEKELVYTFQDDIRAALSAPIFTRGVVVGIIEFGHLQSDAYSPTDQTVFRQIVNQLSVAIENAESYAQSQRLAQSKALVNDISTQLQQQTDIERIMGVTMHELGKALGAKRARIRLTADAITEDGDRE